MYASINDSLPDTLADIRALLSQHPELVDHHERLAALLDVSVFEILAALEALRAEEEILA